MNRGYRELDDREMNLMKKLLEVDFPGCTELRSQLNSLSAKQIIKDGSLSLRPDSGVPFPGKYGLVAEGICKDSDGGQISILLHVNADGYLSMLEILKMDTSPIIRPPSTESFVRLFPNDAGR